MTNWDRLFIWLDASAYNFDVHKEARQKYLALYKANTPEDMERLIPDIVTAEIACFGAQIPQLHSAGYAPGSYLGTCHDCRNEFTGDKRAFTCIFCARGEKQ